jgi:hypothetical protein
MKIIVEIEPGTEVELTEDAVNFYMGIYPNYTPASVILALALVIAKHGKLDGITVNYFVVEPEYGGLGTGIPETEENIRHIRYLCGVQLGEES